MRRPRRRLGRRLVDPFPTLGGNSLVAIEKGPDFFDRMLAAIGEATATVDVEMYLWDDDEVGRRFVDALRGAAARGRRVRVLVDAHGARAVESPLLAVDAAGGDVRVFNPFRLRFLNRYVHRTHKKILVCDGSLAFTGGAGFSLHWSSGRRSGGPWHDRIFEVRGPVVRQIERVFETDFLRWRPRAGGARRESPDATIDLAQPGTAHLRVLRGWPDARDFRAELVAHVKAAKSRVWLGTPYFIAPPSLFRAVTHALKRGIDVRIVVPSGNFAHPLLWHAARRHYGWFLRRGARIFEFARGFYHAKLAVIDRDAAIVGSSNLDYWSWNRNAEFDLLASDPAAVDAAASWFEDDAAKSRELTLRDIGVRGAVARMQDRVASWIEDWL